MDILKKANYGFEDLKEIIMVLRSENGCPWDREQTHESIRNEIIEEVYEAVEAIDERNPAMLREELGDVLLEVMFHARISEEAGDFDINDVCDGICKKLIYRHPHVFSGESNAETAEQVLVNWEELKIKEKGFENAREYLASAAKSLPALARAEKIYKRARKCELTEPLNRSEKLARDIENLTDINFENKGETEIFETLGRILFNISGLASEFNVNPEQALYFYNEQFIKRLLIE